MNMKLDEVRSENNDVSEKLIITMKLAMDKKEIYDELFVYSMWHDLRKNPKDVPKKDGRYLCRDKRGYSNVFGYSNNLHEFDKSDFKKSDGNGFYAYDFEFGYRKLDSIIAWMDIPKFEEEK